MQRRKFIQSIGIAAVGAAIAPQVMANNFGKSQHLVFCILGGGVRKSDLLGDVSAMPLLTKFSNQKVYDNLFFDGDEINHYAACEALLNLNCENENIFELHRKSQVNNSNYQSFFVVNQRANYVSLVENIAADYKPKIIGTVSKNSALPFANDEAVFNMAIEIMEQLKPDLVVLNLQDADVAHSNYDDYIKVLNHADNQIEKLWQAIESNSSMKDNTVFVIVPEHGRNNYENEIISNDGIGGLDHHHQSAREIFAIVRKPIALLNDNAKDNTRLASSSFLSQLLG